MVGGIQKLTLGMFTVYSATGTVGANQSQQINVECMADRQGKHTEVHTYIHTYIHKYVYVARLHTQLHSYIHVCVRVCVCVCAGAVN